MGRLLAFRRRARDAAQSTGQSAAPSSAQPEPGGLDLADLYTRHGGMVLRRVRRFFKDPAEAEEVLHEVFLRALEKQASYRAEASPTTWLYQMTTNHCLNRLRNADRRRAALDLNAELPWLHPSASAPADDAAFLGAFWASLDDDTATIAVYFFIDGMTHAEIARLTGVSRRTIGNRIQALQADARAAAGLDV
jgi:RNA polymerase sigma factor (sigma-70 family)